MKARAITHAVGILAVAMMACSSPPPTPPAEKEVESTSHAAAALAPAGASCQAASDCASRFCVDGVCCNTACGGGALGDCQACAVAKGALVNGRCEPVRAGTTCRAQTGACDVAESCDGTRVVCPADKAAPRSTICRVANGACDVDDHCDGAGKTCPADAFRPASFTCRAKAGVCDVADKCTGNSAHCPSDQVAPPTTQCRGKAGVCDVPEMCTGQDAACPGDAMASPTTVCRTASNVCDAPEMCSGNAPACPADGMISAGTVCRPLAGPCDVAEVCTGSTKACPGDKFLPRTTTCRAARAGGCDVAEICTGTNSSCPADQGRPNGTECTDGNACTRTDSCQAGTCTGGNLVTCVASDQCQGAGVCDPASGQCSNVPAPDGTDCESPCATGSTCRAGVCQAGPALLCGSATFYGGGELPFAAPPRSLSATVFTDELVILISSRDARPYLWNPMAGTGTFGAPFPGSTRTHFVSVRLSDGRIFVSGGLSGQFRRDTWLYDQARDRWTAGPDMGTARVSHKAVLLPGGRVALVGGAARGVEIYDPASNSFVGSIDTPPFNEHAAVLLTDGRIFVAGGPETPGFIDVGAGTFTPSPALPAVRYQPFATLLSDGRVALAGGAGDQDARPVDTFDPATLTWSRSAPSRVFHWMGAAGRTLDGKIVLAGGLNNQVASEIYDPANGLWADGPTLTTGRQDAYGVLLPKGDFLVVGGISEEGEPTAVESMQFRGFGDAECTDLGSCNLATGTCSTHARPDGLRCTSVNTCNGPAVCRAGSCQAGGALPAEITIGAAASDVEISRDGLRAYVTSAAGLSIVDPATRAVMRTIPLSAVPRTISASPDGRKLFIGHGYEGGHNLLSVVDLIDPPTVSVIDLGQGRYPGSDPTLLAPNGRLYSGRYPLGNLTTIDPASGQILASTPLGRDYGAHLALSPDGNKLYISHFDGAVTVFDITQPAPVALPAQRLDVPGGAIASEILSSSEALVLAWETGALLRYDLSTGQVTRSISVGPFRSPAGMALTRDRGRAFVTSNSDDQLVIVDLPTGANVQRRATGRGPQKVALSPEGSVAYVTNATDGTLSMLPVCLPPGPLGGSR